MSERAWKDFFNHYAPLYHRESFTQNTLVEVDFLEKTLQLKPRSMLLDIGCGRLGSKAAKA